MPHALVPSDGVAQPARFIRSVVLPRPGGPLPVDPDAQALADAHGFTEPEPPPGTDPRLWCMEHHRPRRLMGGHGSYHARCIACAPPVFPHRVRGERFWCAAHGCRQAARWDVYGVPVCGVGCVERIGVGCGVRVHACALRVVAVRSESDQAIIFGCFPHRARVRPGESPHSLRVHWWCSNTTAGRVAVLRWPKLERGKFTPRATVLTDDVLADLFVQLARVGVPEARPVVRAAMRWARGKTACPWETATLQPVLDRMAEMRRERWALRAAVRQSLQSG